MPQFHFNVTDGHAIALDMEGTDLANVAAVQLEAYESVRTLMASSDDKGLCRRHWRMDVTTDSGQPVYSLQFAHALVPDQLVSSRVRQMV